MIMGLAIGEREISGLYLNKLLAGVSKGGILLYGEEIIPEPVLIDSYASSNFSYDGYSEYQTVRGQTFTSSGVVLDLITARFWLKQEDADNAPTVSKLYAMTGTYGTNGIPTGTPLAVSDVVSLNTMSASYSWVEYTFSAPYTLVPNTHYCITVGLTTESSGNFVIGIDSTSPAHTGNNFASYDDPPDWGANASRDLVFEVYGV